MSKISVSLQTTAILIGLVGISACQAESPPTVQESAQNSSAKVSNNLAFKIHKVAQFNEPWAIQQLPDGRLILTEKQGQLIIFNPKTQQKTQVSGVPEVAYEIGRASCRERV